MLPVRFEPMKDLRTLQREFDDLVHRVFGVAGESGGELAAIAVPTVNSYVKDGTLHLEAELPGVDADQLDVEVDGRQVIITGERRSVRDEEKADFLLHESRVSRFERRLMLPEGADSDQAEASYRDGLLEITMPMIKSKATGRKLAIAKEPAKAKGKEVH